MRFGYFSCNLSTKQASAFPHRMDGTEQCEETLSLDKSLLSQVNYLLGILYMLMSPLDHHGVYPKEYSLSIVYMPIDLYISTSTKFLTAALNVKNFQWALHTSP